MGVSFALMFLFVAIAASCALGAGSAWLVVRKTKRPVLWVLAPLFAVLWLAVGAVPLGALAWRASAVPAPAPLPAPVKVAPAGEAS